MEIYRAAWACAALGIVGIAAAYDVADGGTLRVLALIGMVASFSATLAFALAEESARRWWWTWRAFAWSGLAIGALDALVRTWSAVGLVAAVLLVLTCPALLRTGRTQWFSWSLRHAPGPPESMSRKDLLRRWAWTGALLERPGPNVAGVLALVEERRRLLDELERRDPATFHAWLSTAVPDRRPPRSRR